MFKLYLRQRDVSQPLGYYEFVIDEAPTEELALALMNNEWLPKVQADSVFAITKYHHAYSWDETVVLAKVLPKKKLGIIRENRMSVSHKIMDLPHMWPIDAIYPEGDYVGFYKKFLFYNDIKMVDALVEQKVSKMKMVLFYIDLFDSMANAKGQHDGLSKLMSECAHFCDNYLMGEIDYKYMREVLARGIDLYAQTSFLGNLMNMRCHLVMSIQEGAETYFTNIIHHFNAFNRKHSTKVSATAIGKKHFKVIDLADHAMFLEGYPRDTR